MLPYGMKTCIKYVIQKLDGLMGVWCGKLCVGVGVGEGKVVIIGGGCPESDPRI